MKETCARCSEKFDPSYTQSKRKDICPVCREVLMLRCKNLLVKLQRSSTTDGMHYYGVYSDPLGAYDRLRQLANVKNTPQEMQAYGVMA